MALKSNQRSALVITALTIAGIGILRSVFTYGQNYLGGEYISQKVAYDLRNALYDRLQRLSYSFHDRAQTGQLMSRATADVEGVRAFVGFHFVRGFYFMVLLIVIVVLLFLIDWRMALLSLSVLPFICYRTIVISRRLRVLWMKIQQGLGVLGVTLSRKISQVRASCALLRVRILRARNSTIKQRQFTVRKLKRIISLLPIVRSLVSSCYSRWAVFLVWRQTGGRRSNYAG